MKHLPLALLFLLGTGCETPRPHRDPASTELGTLIVRAPYSELPAHLRDYACKHHLDTSLFATGRECDMEGVLLGQLALIHGTGHDGFIMFVDILEDRIVLSESLDMPDVTVLGWVNASPQYIIRVDYRNGHGTGGESQATRFYVADHGFATLALEKPLSESISGWNAFEKDPVTFESEITWSDDHGICKLSTQGKVIIGEGEDAVDRPLPTERYVYDVATKRFKQTEGRSTEGQTYMSSVYGDIADPKGDWFKTPSCIEKDQSVRPR